jgi:hypothetical protein
MRLGVLLIMHYLIKKNINRGDICPYKRRKNKKFLDPDIVMMYLPQKGFIEKQLCWFAYGEPYVPYKTMVERMVESTSSSSHVHGVVDDIIGLDAMKCECSIIDEEPNANATRFFDILKDFNKPLWYGCTNYSKLSVVT